MLEFTLGAIHVDFRAFHLLKEKIIRHKYRLFDIEGVKSPLFYDPLEN